MERSLQPHTPTSICGSPVAYDANGNSLSYDRDGGGPDLPLTLTYDGENRPVAITTNSCTAKAFGSLTTRYLGGDAEMLFDSAVSESIRHVNIVSANAK